MKYSGVAVLAFLWAGIARAQSPPTQRIPIRTLATLATSRDTLGSVMGLRELSGSRVLVNGGHKLVVFDTQLSSFIVTADSNGTGASRYPEFTGAALMPYLGDSSVILDNQARVLVVIDGNGKQARAFAPVISSDLNSLVFSNFGVPGFDAQGRLVYRGNSRGVLPARRDSTLPPPTRDTARIVRADFETRRVDTVATVSNPRARPPQTTTAANGAVKMTVSVNPLLPALDDWALLSDGAVAVVRGQDYHIDWVYADGRVASTAKMAFDWRRLTDADKQAKIDSGKRLVDSLEAAGKHYSTSIRSRVNDDGRSVTDTVYPAVAFVPLSEMSDYIPPIRANALKPDRDGNLWILPTTSAQASGGLLYDVVNQNGEVQERVQLPAGCDIAGFAPGGIVYLTRRVGTGVLLIRARLVRNRVQ